MYIKRCNWIGFVRIWRIYALKQHEHRTTKWGSRGAALRSMNLVGPNNLWSKMSSNYRKLRLLLAVFLICHFPCSTKDSAYWKETKKINWYQVEWYSIFSSIIILWILPCFKFLPSCSHSVYIFGCNCNYCTSGINLPGRLCVVAHKWHLHKQMRAPFYLLCPTQHSILNSLYRVL